MSLTGSLSDLQISIPFSVPSVSEPGPGVRVCTRVPGVRVSRVCGAWGRARHSHAPVRGRAQELGRLRVSCSTPGLHMRPGHQGTNAL